MINIWEWRARRSALIATDRTLVESRNRLQGLEAPTFLKYFLQASNFRRDVTLALNDVFQRAISTINHARASFQSRITRCGEMPSTLAVSSTPRRITVSHGARCKWSPASRNRYFQFLNRSVVSRNRAVCRFFSPCGRRSNSRLSAAARTTVLHASWSLRLGSQRLRVPRAGADVLTPFRSR
jgi:hypothetical protein